MDRVGTASALGSSARMPAVCAVRAVLAVGCAPEGASDDTGAPCEDADPCAAGAAWIDRCAPFDSIQAALDVAAAGATVHVCAGTHHESLHVDVEVHAARLRLEGTGSGSTIIEAQPFDVLTDGAMVREGMVLYADEVDLDLVGLTLRGGTGYEWSPDTFPDSFGGALDLRRATVALTDVLITDNRARIGGAVCAEQCALRFTSSTVQSNTGEGSAVYLLDSSLQSVHSGWGSGVLDNVPVDIEIAAMDDRKPAYYSYGDDASFTCDAQACVDD